MTRIFLGMFTNSNWHPDSLFQSHEQLWMASAQKLTNLIKQIIEFAKMVPGFMKLNQDDQIVLLKKGIQFDPAIDGTPLPVL